MIKIIVVCEDGSAYVTGSIRRAQEEKKVFTYIIFIIMDGKMSVFGTGKEIHREGKLHPRTNIKRYVLVTHDGERKEFFSGIQ